MTKTRDLLPSNPAERLRRAAESIDAVRIDTAYGRPGHLQVEPDGQSAWIIKSSQLDRLEDARREVTEALADLARSSGTTGDNRVALQLAAPKVLQHLAVAQMFASAAIAAGAITAMSGGDAPMRDAVLAAFDVRSPAELAAKFGDAGHPSRNVAWCVGWLAWFNSTSEAAMPPESTAKLTEQRRESSQWLAALVRSAMDKFLPLQEEPGAKLG